MGIIEFPSALKASWEAPTGKRAGRSGSALVLGDLLRLRGGCYRGFASMDWLVLSKDGSNVESGKAENSLR